MSPPSTNHMIMLMCVCNHSLFFFLNDNQDGHCHYHHFITSRHDQRGARDAASCLEYQVCFFFVNYSFFFYTNKYLVIGYSYEYEWSRQRQQGGGKGSRHITTHLKPFICFLNYYFNFLYLLQTTNGVDRGSKGGGKEKGSRHIMTHLKPQVYFI